MFPGNMPTRQPHHSARKKNEKINVDVAISTIQRGYLLKIVDRCSAENVTLVLINIPTYKPAIYDYPVEKLDDYYHTYLQGTKFADYSFYSLPDSCYRDISHLNTQGAKMFTAYLQENLSKDLAKGQ